MMDKLDLSSRAQAALVLTVVALDPATDTERLQGLVESAVAATATPRGAITMLTDQQVTAVVAGDAGDLTELHETRPFEDTICVNALRTGKALVIPDTSKDHRVSSLPQVVEGKVGAYLGAPLRSEENTMVGVLCVWENHPRVWTDDEVAVVTRIADEVGAELARLHNQAVKR